MDLTPYFGGIVSAAVFVAGSYVTMKNASDRRFAAIESRQAAQDVQIAMALDEAHVSRDLTTQLAALSTKIDDLRRDVERHNSVVERTLKLETEMRTQWKRVDDLRDEVHDMKVGGSK